MPAIDRCEPQIIRALEKEGWRVVRRHFPIPLNRLGERVILVDLRLQKASEAAPILVVETKCFEATPFPLSDFYMALGQYLVYLNALQVNGFTEALYLAMPDPAYHYCLTQDAIQGAMNDAKMKLIVVNLEIEEIVQWIH